MNKYSFHNWLQQRVDEYANFGLDLAKRPKPIELTGGDEPFKTVNIEYVCNQLKRASLGIKESMNDTFFGEVQWGVHPGAVKVNFGPYSGLRAVVRKLCTDLKGEARWVCKKVLEVRHKYDHSPDTLVQELHGVVETVDNQQIDAPSSSYKKLENLVLHMASNLRRHTTQKILIYEGIRRIKENEHYIIHFGCTGMGVQRQDQKRLDQFQIEVRYFPEAGYISINGQELGDSIKSHRWIVDPAEFTEFYMPSQPHEEIIGTVLAHLNSY